jgi:hypothetical protein
MSLTYNAGTVTNAQNTFYATSNGAVQGFFQDDPAVRFQLRSGIVSPSQSTPLWGGMGIAVNLPTATAEHDSFKAVLSLATSQANLMGFTVWNQSLAVVLNPSVQNPVPQAAAGGGGSIPGGAINFFLLGSNAQIWVQCSSAVAALFKSGAYNQAAYWDYTNQVLLQAPGGTAIAVQVVDLVTNGNAAVVASGGNSWNYSGFAALIKI